MRVRICLFVAIGSFVCLGSAAVAELQNVTVGGKIEIYGAAYSDFYARGGEANAYGRWPLNGRPIGHAGTATGVTAGARRSNQGFGYVQQRTRLNLRADFTDDVAVFVELDDVTDWGEDFRSVNYLTGVDTRADSVDDVEIFQSYIEANNVYGLPLTLRIGRQALDFGSGWIVGSDYGGDPFIATSFDAVRLTYTGDSFTADAWWGKMSESLSDFGQGDIDFYGIYLTCTAIEEMSFDLYWLYVRDDAALDLGLSPASIWLGKALDIVDFDTSNLHTVGARWTGTRGPWDWEAEAAFQFGEADAASAYSRPWPGLFGDDSAHWGQGAGHAEVGYTLETAWSPRFFLGGAYYGGEDNRDISFGQWLNPFDRPEASLSFNRLFSIYCEEWLMDTTIQSNFWHAYVGAGVSPTEKLSFEGKMKYLEVVAPFNHPVFFLFPWWTREGSSSLGWESSLTATYQYSKDLKLDIGWHHYFTGGAFKDGAFIMENGTRFAGGFDDGDGDYVCGKITVEF